ncbi:hypothetical protein BL254_07975 [Protofrankia sp. BMG5.30]|uniref:ATP/GTP-binding protein n=1 Tax=Protofrankia coriariae TaxID=1562887 RepID=A0ABR5F7S6_9ACTN|nr:hypothetical protein [Protofrankia sp. BMG5.30]KLL12735.1 ATP/GTP-binding protein [Protofrankia coriariae]ONH36096.1 hypothetical protein BL254_07975 [Protofrankia sp. BMG5.30]
MTRSRSRRARAQGRAQTPRAPVIVGSETTEQHPDGDWVVRRVSGAAAWKRYRCPGCEQEIVPATPHVVCWPDEQVADRRHWHTICWTHRGRRNPPGRSRPGG